MTTANTPIDETDKPDPTPEAAQADRATSPDVADRCRVRLVVRDPETLFAFWTLGEGVRVALCRELGERVAVLATVTIRLFDVRSGASRLLLQRGSGSATYLPVDPDWGPHQAELGLVLPSGEFRRVATSNVVLPPRPGPSSEPASRSLSYGHERVSVPAPGPDPRVSSQRRARVVGSLLPSLPGGASDEFRPGGASDTFRP
jgi:hypothetical protein